MAIFMFPFTPKHWLLFYFLTLKFLTPDVINNFHFIKFNILPLFKRTACLNVFFIGPPELLTSVLHPDFSYTSFFRIWLVSWLQIHAFLLNRILCHRNVISFVYPRKNNISLRQYTNSIYDLFLKALNWAIYVSLRTFLKLLVII